MRRITDFSRYHSEKQPISMVTCYDAWTARLLKDPPIDAVLVGDSVAMVMHGFDSTVHATTDMMATHTAAVRRGIGDKWVVADLPFPVHRLGRTKALEAADTLMKAGANAVKLEGLRGHEGVVSHLVESGVPVMGHLGLTPQSVHQMGGYRIQGREARAADALVEDAKGLAAAGAFAIVLECIPSDLARRVSETLPVPTIGIGSGPHCSGQILVLQDLLGGNTEFKPRFVRTYAELATDIPAALQRFDEDVKRGAYPSVEESFPV